MCQELLDGIKAALPMNQEKIIQILHGNLYFMIISFAMKMHCLILEGISKITPKCGKKTRIKLSGMNDNLMLISQFRSLSCCIIFYNHIAIIMVLYEFAHQVILP